MNQDNLEYLKNQLRYNGFGEELFASLEKKIETADPSFHLAVTKDFEGQPLEAVLQFSRSTKSGQYFFTRYDATLVTGQEKRSHPFYIQSNTKMNISLHEAGNLLSGRAVRVDYVKRADKPAFKKGDAVPVQKIWIQLDLKKLEAEGRYRVTRYYENYGYDIEKALEKAGLKEQLFADQLTLIISQLEAGNRHSVLLQKEEGATQAVLLEACPMFRSFNMYDTEGKMLYVPKMKEAKERVVDVTEPVAADKKAGTKKRKRVELA